LFLIFLTLKVEVIDWPSRSPDLNPIENLWALLKREVSTSNPKSLEELIYSIFKCWKNLDKRVVCSIFNSIYKRIDMVIEREGDVIEY